jgi:purine nucleosidase
LGNSGLPSSGLRETGEHATDQLIRLAEASPGEITLVALGPLTNVAVALARQPELPRLLKSVVVMGGAFTHPGNTSPLAEFNIWVDPEAARSVFEAGFRLTVVPLDATMQTLLTDEHIATLGSGPTRDFVQVVTNAAMERSLQRRGRRAFPMHDPLATAIAVDPSLMLDAPEIPVTVETGGAWTRGFTVGDRRPGKPEVVPPGRATVCLKPDAGRFFDLYVNAVGYNG